MDVYVGVYVGDVLFVTVDVDVGVGVIVRVKVYV